MKLQNNKIERLRQVCISAIEVAMAFIISWIVAVIYCLFNN